MSLLMVSETAMMAGSKLKRNHDTVNGIINGYYPLSRMLTYLGVTKPVTNFGQLGQWTRDQAGKPRMNMNRHELLPFFIGVH